MQEKAFIASYPRSGNTWVRLLVADAVLQLNGRVTGTELPVDVNTIIPDMHQHSDKWQELKMPPGIESPFTLLKTHWQWDLFKARSVFVFRNPEDSLCSYFHYHRRYDHLRGKTTQGLDAFCREFVDEWCHTQSYINGKRINSNEIHFTSYESLHSNPIESLGRILRFLHMEPARFQVELAIENHQFEKQQKTEKAVPNNEPFYRKGKVDSAREELSQDTLAFIKNKAESSYIVAENIEQSQNLIP
jgi:hypothetical protein